jgi:wyosine [tRNA(Phe)-imidazoG37] synthetase (radical SAM superfamily)
MPSRQQVSDALRQQLIKMQQEGPKPDVLTFAGNGEPTMHPHFPEIVDDVIALRNEYFPEAKVSVLSNATQILHQKVFDALMKVDNNILKLDTVSNSYIHRLDRPVNSNYDVNRLIEKMAEFKGHCIVQTMFLNGEFEGKDISNVADEYINPWLEALAVIRPEEVMVYTIDRETPAHKLQKATHEELDAIAARVEARGIKCQVSY